MTSKFISIIIIFAVCLFLNCSGQHKQINMQHQDSSLEIFKQGIDFQRIENQSSTKGVVSNWPIEEIIKEFVMGSWELIAQDVGGLDEGCEATWGFRKGEQTIVLEIFAADNDAVIKDYFLDRTSATSMMQIPYTKTETLIGTISVKSPEPKPQTYIWIYHNVYFHLEGYNTDIEMEYLAKEIQEIAEAGLVDDLSQHINFVEKISIAPEKIAIQDIFQIKPILSEEAAENSDDYILDFQRDIEMIDIFRQEGDHIFFKALKEGDTEIQLKVINQINLLSSSRKISITID